MLPADIIATAINTALPARFAHDGLRKAMVTYSASSIVCVLAVWVAFRFLRRMGFVLAHATAGALTLLFGTTFLHYTQNMMENNLLLLLTLSGISLHYAWTQTGSRLSLFVGALAFGANLLTRVTTVFDLAAGALFVALVFWLKGARGRGFMRQLWRYSAICLPCYAFFFAIDRAYNYYRFGTWWNTYVQIATEHYKRLNPNLPADFPFNTPFWQGFLGPLITPEKSIFLFDPMLALLAALIVIRWKFATAAIKAYVLSLAMLLFAYVCFYAKFAVWSGDVAWGDRYVTTPVQLLALICTPLLLAWRRELPASAWRAALAVIIVSVVIQTASVVLWYPLEFCQMRTAVGHTFVIGLRFKNIAALILGKMDQWRLNNRYTQAYGYKCSTPYLYPFLLLHTNHVPRWAAQAVISGWACVLAGLFWILHRIWLRARSHPEEPLVR